MHGLSGAVENFVGRPEVIASMFHRLDKDVAIHDVLSRLRSDLGDGTFDIVDHWQSDLCAIGIAMPSDHRVLAYISTFQNPPDTYDYELEGPPDTQDTVYSVADRQNGCSYGAILVAVKSHLRIAE